MATICWHNRHTPLLGHADCCAMDWWIVYGVHRTTETHWFWFARIVGGPDNGKHINDFTDSRIEALDAARDSVIKLAAGRRCRAVASHDLAEKLYRKTAFQTRIKWEIEQFGVDLIDIVALRAEMTRAYRDGSAQFTLARHRYEAARDWTRNL